MNNELRDRIAAVVSDHYIEDEGVNWWQCICGQKFYIPQGSYRACEEHVADAVIAELTESIPPIVATAIQGFAQSELAAMSYHGASKDAFEVMEKMNREALQIAQYATKHEDWNA